MEQNHDAKKAALAKRISKFGLLALCITCAAIVLETVLLVLRAISNTRWMLSHQNTEPDDILDYLIMAGNQHFWSNQFPSALLLIAMLMLSVILFCRIRRDGTPFRFENIRLLRISALLMGVRALMDPVERTVIDLLQYSVLSLRSFFSLLFRSNTSFWLCLLLLLCSEVMYFGAVLQKQSDETL